MQNFMLDLLSTLHYHSLYQISSLTADLSLEDMKQIYDRSYLTGQIIYLLQNE